MKPVNPGKYRHSVTIEHPKRITLPNGERKVTYEPEAGASCAIYPVSAREVVRAERVRQDITHTVHMRYRDDVTADCRLRIEWNGYGDPVDRILDIISVINPEEAGIELHLLCQEIAPVKAER